MNNYKYLLHGHFENKVSNLINKTRVHMFKKFKDENLDLSFTYGLPHITIIYGPVIKANNKLSLNKKTINNMYPGFFEKFKELPSDIKYIGISVFFSINRIIIKAEFESKQLNKMRHYLINTNPLIKSYYDEFKRNYKKNEKILREKFKNIYVKDKTYNKNPTGWIHASLLVVKSDIDEKKLIKMIKESDKIFKLNKNYILSLKEIGINLNNNFYKIF